MAQLNNDVKNRFTESLFQAMDVITSKRIGQLEFDKTITCQIVNTDNSGKGEYIVSDGSTTFIAYSENPSYSEGTWVYVTIPNGDFDEQKYITGKYIADNTEYSTYRNPLDSFVDITGNLVNIDNSQGLIANISSKKEIILWRSGDLFLSPTNSTAENPLDISITETTKEYSNFDRLGIQASFKTLLGAYNVVSGHYGLRLDIVSLNPGSTSTTASHNFSCIKLDSDDMFGNPYNFITWSQQQYVFDISELENIIGMQLVFYQDDDFINTDNQRIPNYSSEEEQKAYLAMANILVQDIYIGLGYDLMDFQQDDIFVYTFDPLTYASYLTDTTKTIITEAYPELDLNSEVGAQTALQKINERNIYLRWIHMDDDDNIEAIEDIEDIDTWEDDDENILPMANVHWYRWKLEEGVEDSLAGVFWEEEPSQLNTFTWENFNPNPMAANEKIKVVIEYPTTQYIQWLYNNTIEEHLESLMPQIIEEEGLDLDDPNSTELLNARLAVEDEKYQISLRGDQILYEDIIEFTNEQEVPNQTTVELLRGLQLACDEDHYNGVYRIYNPDGQIMNSGEANLPRIITARFNTLVTGDKTLDKAERITWYFPIRNTMIEYPAYGVEYITNPEDPNGETAGLDDSGEWFKIERNGVQATDRAAGEIVPTALEQVFRIKPYYTQSSVNNTILCEISKNNKIYYAEYTLYFGISGSNGTDYTLTVTCEEYDEETNEWISMSSPVLYCENHSIRLVPHVFDYENKEVTDNYDDSNFYFSFYSKSLLHGEEGLEYQQDGKNFIISTTNHDDPSRFYHYIVEVMVKKVVTVKSTNNKNSGDTNTITTTDTATGLNVNLTSYCPIAICFDDIVVSTDGDNRITYDPSGVNPTYYKGEYALYQMLDNRYQKIDGIEWSIDLGKDNDKDVEKYYPQIDYETGELIVPAMYMSGNEPTVSIIAVKNNEILWCQPLYISQDVYASAMMNAWDGSLTIDEDNGTIMSAMVGAGYKDSANRFNGVLMGNVAKNIGVNSNNANTGLFGYHEGEQSFGLKINGTAFLGKSGHGRIEFDGNSGQIKSANWSSHQGGMRIDIDDAYIDFEGTPYESGQAKVHIGVNGSSSDSSYFKIVDHFNSTLMLISDTNQYLQSSDFSISDKVGMKFDIYNNKITAYDFELNALNSYGEGIKISSDGSPYLRIVAEGAYNDTQTIFEASTSSYYLQSWDYNAYSETGVKFDLLHGRLTGYDFTLKAISDDIGFMLSSSGEPFLQIRGSGSDSGINLLYVSDDEFYLQSWDYSPSDQTGTKFNITDGQITSYNFNITAKDARSEESDKYIRINSGAIKYPIIVGKGSDDGSTIEDGDFAVQWDGSINATNGLIGNWGITKEGLFSDGIPTSSSFTGLALYSKASDGDQTDPLRISVGKVSLNPIYYIIRKGENTDPGEDTDSEVNKEEDWIAVSKAQYEAWIAEGGDGEIDYNPDSTSKSVFVVTKAGKLYAKNPSFSGVKFTSTSSKKLSIVECTITKKLTYKGNVYSARSMIVTQKWSKATVKVPYPELVSSTATKSVPVPSSNISASASLGWTGEGDDKQPYAYVSSVSASPVSVEFPTYDLSYKDELYEVEFKDLKRYKIRFLGRSSVLQTN